MSQDETTPHESVKDWKEDNPKPKRKDFEDREAFKAAKAQRNATLDVVRARLRARRRSALHAALAKAEDAVRDAAIRAVPGEVKREAAILEVLEAVDRALKFPDTVLGKLAEMGSDWFIYHPLRDWAEDAVDKAYARLVKAGEI